MHLMACCPGHRVRKETPKPSASVDSVCCDCKEDNKGSDPSQAEQLNRKTLKVIGPPNGDK
jgi:hypothetical protein